MNIFAILFLRVVAFVLVTYLSVSVDVAVAITSDPDIVAAVNVGIAAAVVMFGETLGKYIGKPAVALVMRVLQKVAAKLADKVVIRK